MNELDLLEEHLHALLPTEWFEVVRREDWTALRELHVALGGAHIVAEIGKHGLTMQRHAELLNDSMS